MLFFTQDTVLCSFGIECQNALLYVYCHLTWMVTRTGDLESPLLARSSYQKDVRGLSVGAEERQIKTQVDKT